MKKFILATALIAIGTIAANAQKSRYLTAKDYLADDNYKKAIVELDAASAHESTKDNPDVWFYRGYAYYKQAEDTVNGQPGAIDEAVKSFYKAVELKPKYIAPDFVPVYYTGAKFFKNGASAFNGGQYEKAYQNFASVSQLYAKTQSMIGSEGNGPALKKAFTELATNAKSNAALSAINAQKYDEALSMYNEIKATENPKDTNTYYAIIKILEKQNKKEELGAIIAEARTLWPNNKQIINQEINYYISAGNPEVLLGKLQSATAVDPNNADLYYNMANIYEKMSFPKDANGKPTARPATAAESFAKADENYKKAIAVNATNAVYHYNYGVLYYEYALAFNTEANGIKGQSAADNKKFDDLITKRNAQFKLAAPHFEDAFNLLDPKAKSLNSEDLVTYKNAVQGLYEIYSRIDDKAKHDLYKNKYEAAKSL